MYGQPKLATLKLFGSEIEFAAEAKLDKYYGVDVEERVMQVLRLWAAGEVHRGGTLTRVDAYFHRSYSPRDALYRAVSTDRAYKIQPRDLDGLGRLWRTLGDPNVVKRNFLTVALRRFGQAAERTHFGDSVIDHFVAFEALFLADQPPDRGELRYRLSLRAAHFVEYQPDRRYEIFRFMKNAYDVRSRIVHGSEHSVKLPPMPEAECMTEEQFLDRIETVGRIAITKAVNMAAAGHTPEQLIDWDGLIFGKNLETRFALNPDPPPLFRPSA